MLQCGVHFPPIAEIRSAGDTERSVGSFVVLALITFAAASINHCPVEHAKYVLRHDPDVTAYFQDVGRSRDWPSGVALVVHHKRSRQTSWWLPWLGGTDGLRNVASTEDVTKPGWSPPNPDGGPRPHGDRQYVGTDGAYNVIDDIPRSGSIAPVHMLFPNSASAHDTAFPVKQFFDLVDCGGRPSSGRSF
jgi:hypothetical protein